VNSGARGLPPRIFIPIVVLAAAIVIGTVVYFLRIALGVSGSAIGPSSPSAHATPAPLGTRAPGEAVVPQSGGVPEQGGLPGNSVGGGGPAAASSAAPKPKGTR
jgi:hypothetical protein